MPDGTMVYPGHRYSAPASATIDAIRHDNYVYAPANKDQWLAAFSR
jgi:hypothetical protein